MNCCITCKHFRDAEYSKTYITPRCTQRGDDAAMWMRANLCGLDGKLYEAKPDPRNRDVLSHPLTVGEESIKTSAA